MNEERPIEKLLRRYAEKRREEAGTPELHPATRRLLQSEVARQFPKPEASPEKTPFVQVLKAWLPWLGWSTAMIVVVAVVGVTMFRASRPHFYANRGVVSSPVELAKNEPAPDPNLSQNKERDAESRKQLAVTPPVASAPAISPTKTEAPASKSAPATVVLEDETKTARELKPSEEAIGGAKPSSQLADKDRYGLGRESANLSAQSTQPTPGGPQPSPRLRSESQDVASVARRSGTATRADAPPPASLGNFADGKVAADKLTVADTASVNGTIAPTNQAEVAKSFAGGSFPDRGGGGRGAASASFQAKEIIGQKAQNISQAYANVDSVKRFKNSGDAQFNAVLENFRIEQTGDQLRVIDGDGSTYLGSLLSTVYSEKLTKAKTETKGAEQLKKDAEAAAPRPVTDEASRTDAAQAYLYRVAGTNRTLNQHVEFSWNFVPTNTVLLQEVSGKLDAQQNRGAQLAPSVLQNSEVSGEVKVDAQRYYRIKAVPAK